MKLNFSLKDIIYILIIGVLAFFGWRIYTDLKQEFVATSVEFKKLSESLARAENQMVTKTELDAWARANDVSLKDIKKDLRGLGASLEAVGHTVAKIEGKVEEGLSSGNSDPVKPPEQPDTCSLCDIHGYTATRESIDFTLGKLPAGKCLFEAGKIEPWSLIQDEIDIDIKTTLGSQQDGLFIFYHEVGLLNNSREELAGKLFPVKIVESEFRQVINKPKEFMWWAPALDLTVDNSFVFSDTIGYKFGASLGFSFLAYGKDSLDNDWRFARLGVGVNTGPNFYAILEPARYNLGNFIPLVSDLWLGAGALYDGSWGFSISIGTRL